MAQVRPSMTSEPFITEDELACLPLQGWQDNMGESHASVGVTFMDGSAVEQQVGHSSMGESLISTGANFIDG